MWLTLLAIVGAALMVRLGMWQLERMEERQALNAMIAERITQPPIALNGAPIDPQALNYRRVEIRGIFDPAQEIVIRGRALNGVPGVHVVTPLRIAGSDAAVLVDRGWLPLAKAEPEARSAFAIPGEVVVQGIARQSQEEQSGPPDPPPGPNRTRLDVWFRVNIPRIQEQIGYRLLPVYVEQQPAPGLPDLPRPIQATDLGAGPHLGYAIQWFAFVIILVAGYLALMYRQLQAAKAAEPR